MGEPIMAQNGFFGLRETSLAEKASRGLVFPILWKICQLSRNFKNSSSCQNANPPFSLVAPELKALKKTITKSIKHNF